MPCLCVLLLLLGEAELESEVGQGRQLGREARHRNAVSGSE